jgi:hypothetical protein
LRPERNQATAVRGGGSQYYSLQLVAANFPPGTTFATVVPIPTPITITASARLLPRR